MACAAIWPCRIHDRRCNSGSRDRIEIIDPLGHIAARVIDSERIGLESTHRGGRCETVIVGWQDRRDEFDRSAISVIPAFFWWRPFRAPGEFHGLLLTSVAHGEHPLSLGRQTVTISQRIGWYPLTELALVR